MQQRRQSIENEVGLPLRAHSRRISTNKKSRLYAGSSVRGIPLFWTAAPKMGWSATLNSEVVTWANDRFFTRRAGTVNL